MQCRCTHLQIDHEHYRMGCTVCDCRRFHAATEQPSTLPGELGTVAGIDVEEDTAIGTGLALAALETFDAGGTDPAPDSSSSFDGFDGGDSGGGGASGEF